MRTFRHSLLFILLSVVCTLLLAATARAQDDVGGRAGAGLTKPKDSGAPAVPPPAPVIVLPVLKSDPGAAYPKQALDDGVKETVTVVLILTLDATGKVTDARVETPVGHGFDEVALEAAKQVEFTPATKDGTAVAAKVKHKYVFPPPPGRLVVRVSAPAMGPIAGASVTLRSSDGVERMATTDSVGIVRLESVPFGAYHLVVTAQGFKKAEGDQEVAPGEEVSNVFRLTADAPPPAPDGGTAPQDDIEDVVVRGQKPAREVTKRTLEQRELLRSPGSNGDALRALQNLPGIARPPGLAGLLIVRGAAPNETQIFVDGTNVPLIYHFGGLSSVVPTEFLEKIDFYPGNFSAQYGRALGGIVDVGIRAPKKDKLHAIAQIDLIDARLLAEGPLPGGFSFAVGGRRSWIDAWLGPVLEATGASVTSAPVYYDYQAMLQKDFGKDTSLRALFFGSDDKLELLLRDVSAAAPTLTGSTGLHTAFWRGQIQFKSKLGPSTEVRLVAAIGQDRLEFNIGDIFFNLDTYPVSGRAELSQKVTGGVTAHFGLDMFFAPYTVDARLPTFPAPGVPPGGPGISTPPLAITDSGSQYRPGMYGELEVVPWKGARIVPGIRIDYAKDIQAWDVAPRVSMRQDLGPAFPRTTIKGGIGVFYQPPQPQQSNAVFGQPGLKSQRAIHYGLGIEREITKNLEVSFEGFYKQLDDLVVTGSGNSGIGWIYGAETLIRYKPDSHFFGWIAYTLSRSIRQDTPDSPARVTQYDQTHILTVLGSYRLGHGWEFGARFRLVSGNNYTPQTYGFYDANAGTYLPLQSYPAYNARLPMFHQLDIRLDKTWKFVNWQLGVYADVVNVYNAGNVEGTSYNYNSTRSSYVTGLPLLPSLGLRGEF
ncbi:TonB-dependent receptor [soil metagenome]